MHARYTRGGLGLLLPEKFRSSIFDVSRVIFCVIYRAFESEMLKCSNNKRSVKDFIQSIKIFV